MEKIAVVFVCNKAYLQKFKTTYNQLIKYGKYNGEIVLVVGDDLKDLKLPRITIVNFPEIKFSEEFNRNLRDVKTDRRNITKLFQWHKLYLFNTYFKQWDYILYIDCGMTILNDITPIINCREPDVLLAHSDSYPLYTSKLKDQFDSSNSLIYKKLEEKYNLNIDYFQTGILLYNTKIIEEKTMDELIKLSEEFPITKTNEQAIMALYFTNIRPIWKQVPLEDEKTKYYDFCRRNNPLGKPYIIYKSNKVK